MIFSFWQWMTLRHPEIGTLRKGRGWTLPLLHGSIQGSDRPCGSLPLRGCWWVCRLLVTMATVRFPSSPWSPCPQLGHGKMQQGAQGHFSACPLRALGQGVALCSSRVQGKAAWEFISIKLHSPKHGAELSLWIKYGSRCAGAPWTCGVPSGCVRAWHVEPAISGREAPSCPVTSAGMEARLPGLLEAEPARHLLGAVSPPAPVGCSLFILRLVPVAPSELESLRAE